MVGPGGRAYRKMIGDKIGDQVAAIEMDEGAEKPLGMGYGDDRCAAAASWFGGCGGRRDVCGPAGCECDAGRCEGVSGGARGYRVDAGADWDGYCCRRVVAGRISRPLMADGVPALSPRTVDAHYFDWHHTEADTLDKVDPVEFRKNAAMLSVVTYVLADMDGRLAGRKSAAAE